MNDNRVKSNTCHVEGRRVVKIVGLHSRRQSRAIRDKYAVPGLGGRSMRKYAAIGQQTKRHETGELMRMRRGTKHCIVEQC